MCGEGPLKRAQVSQEAPLKGTSSFRPRCGSGDHRVPGGWFGKRAPHPPPPHPSHTQSDICDFTVSDTDPHRSAEILGDSEEDH